MSNDSPVAANEETSEDSWMVCSASLMNESKYVKLIKIDERERVRSCSR